MADDPYAPMPLPAPVTAKVPFYLDRSMSMSVDSSVLSGSGAIIGRVTFEFDEEEMVGIIVQSTDNRRIWLECPGIGIVMFTLENIGGVMVDVLCADGDECQLPEACTSGTCEHGHDQADQEPPQSIPRD